jgi:hypothetical protein
VSAYRTIFGPTPLSAWTSRAVRRFRAWRGVWATQHAVSPHAVYFSSPVFFSCFPPFFCGRDMCGVAGIGMIRTKLRYVCVLCGWRGALGNSWRATPTEARARQS